ncbi:MAG: flagellar M-ring protein FliF [Spirochaetaceae bacterium]|jgi:flagellar M-ring protein FliF|nr:flagellar M-ring protein FliF [Spirochaetaceae bacterium]
MNEWIKKFLEQIRNLWGKWSMIQRLILIGIAFSAVIAVIVVTKVSSSPSMVPVIDAPIRDEDARDRIVTRINEEGAKVQVTADGTIMVQDEKAARRLRALLIREDLIPRGTDPWAIFDQTRWTITDFERDINKQRAQTQMITNHIKSLDEVDDADVTVVWPKDELFASEQNPVTASVIIIPRPGSDIIENRKKIEGIQKILKFAVEGLTDDHIVITDQRGLILNDFENMAAFDRINQTKQEQVLIQALEGKYRGLILQAVQGIFTADRVRDLNIKIDMDMSKKQVNSDEKYPIMLKDRTPGLAYDDSERAASLTVSEATSSTQWKGTGFVPEGPAGTEGQMPANYKDMSNLFGEVSQETRTTNYEFNQRSIEEVRSPSPDRVTVSVNIDGQWKWKYDEKGKPVVLIDNSIDREYIPVSGEDLRKVQGLIQDAIGFSPVRGDSVTVQNIPFDRTRQFLDEDARYFRQQRFQTTVMLFVSGLALLLVSFIAYRLIYREMERRRRLREEELSRQHQMMRESALRQAEEDGVEVSMSVEERKRMELQDNAISLAREHPEDVAQLIRTWLLEE